MPSNQGDIVVTMKRIGTLEKETFKLRCQKRITIGQIKEKVFGFWELPMHEQVIVFRGQQVSADDRAQPLNTPDLAEIVEEAGENGLQMAVMHKPRKLPAFLEQEGLEDVNCRRPTEATALHRAARKNELTVMEEILACPDFAEAEARDNAGQTALHVAVATWNRPACEILLKTTKFSFTAACDTDERTALHLAACWGDAMVVRWILEHWNFKAKDAAIKDAFGRTALEYAISRGHDEAAKLITEACKKPAPEPPKQSADQS